MTVTGSRVLLLAAGAFFTVAALTEAMGLGVGPAWGWAFGGFAAWALAGAVP